MKDEDYRSEEGQLFAQMRERKRLQNVKIMERALKDSLNWAGPHSIKISNYASHAIRFEAPLRKLDIFPQTKKFHDITNNVRGNYKDMITFLNHHFNK